MLRSSRSLLLCALAALAAAASRPRAAEPAPTPDARRGEALYVGATRLAAGGAPCLACHGIAGHGLARAASFGPDLSGAHAAYGADGLEGLLEDVPFPSMVPVYRGHALTKEERSDVIAFLGEPHGSAPARLGAGFGAAVAAAMAVFLGAFVTLGRRRRSRGPHAAGRTP